MKILSIDVGIKNLAICIIDILDKSHTIIDWAIINCAQDIIDASLKCGVIRKKGVCKKMAVNKVITIHNKDVELGYCHLKTCQKELHANYTKKQIKKIKKLNSNHISINVLAKILYRELEKITGLDQIEMVIIENQPVLKNPKMKSIQMIVFSFFLFKSMEHSYTYEVKLFNASKKLKIYDGPEIKTTKKKYAKRKFLSIEYTKYFIKKFKIDTKWLESFNEKKKKDDFADCYLQALTYYHRYHS